MLHALINGLLTMLEKLLYPGDHTVTWTNPGYNPLYATINVGADGSVSCVPVPIQGDICGRDVPPGVMVSDTLVTGYLEATDGYVDYEEWLAGQGGASGVEGNLMAVGAIISGYLDP